MTYNSHDSHEDNQGCEAVRGVCMSIDIWVSRLIQLDHYQTTNHVHECRIYTHKQANSSTDLLVQSVFNKINSLQIKNLHNQRAKQKQITNGIKTVSTQETNFYKTNCLT